MPPCFTLGKSEVVSSQSSVSRGQPLVKQSLAVGFTSTNQDVREDAWTKVQAM